ENGISDNYIFISLHHNNSDTLRISASCDSLFYSYHIEGNKKNVELTKIRDLRLPLHHTSSDLKLMVQNKKIAVKNAIQILKKEHDRIKQRLWALDFDGGNNAYNLLSL